VEHAPRLASIGLVFDATLTQAFLAGDWQHPD
jgi:hypothetical protein